MFIFAHLFAGALLGLIFWHLTNDRRAVPLGFAASILPDVVDKSFGLLFPFVLGGGRTVFHSLMIVGVLLILCLLLFVRSRSVLLGVGVACAILLHQVLDEMWMQTANWFYPLLGPFQGQMIPDYMGVYFWLEITNPSEWLFLVASVVILVGSYQDMLPVPRSSWTDTIKAGAFTLVGVALMITGCFLVFTGLTSTTATFITPLYSQESTVVAGLLAVCGALVMSRETFDTPQRGVP
jgi:membrane-bound metal-dependent hydrolase YbcI (DUF457 family)